MDGFLDIGGSPLLEPRIHPEAARAIWSDALPHASSKQFLIEITVPSADLGRDAEVSEAIRHHFFWQTEEAKGGTPGNFPGRTGEFGHRTDGRGAPLGGLGSDSFLGKGRLVTTLSESMIIFAWVAMWSPAELLLYAHLPVRRRRNLAQALARAAVVLRSSDSP